MADIELPEVELNIYSPKQPAEATIVENYVCTAENSPNIIRHITFDLSGTDLVGNLNRQSIGILPPRLNEKVGRIIDFILFLHHQKVKNSQLVSPL